MGMNSWLRFFVVFYCAGAMAEETPMSLETFFKYKKMYMENRPNIENITRALSSLYHDPAVRSVFTNQKKLESFLTKTEVSTGCSQSLVYSVAHPSSWTYNMIDATGKLPAAIQYVATNWLGSFKQCMNNPPPNPYHSSGTPPRSHYCKVNIGSPFMQFPGIPEIYINWGLCLPESCNRDDVNFLLHTVVNTLQPANVSYVQLRPRTTYCYIRQEEMKFSTPAIIMLIVIAVSVAVIFLGTVYDVLVFQRRKAKTVSVAINKLETSLEMTESTEGRNGFDNETYEETKEDRENPENSSHTNIEPKEVRNGIHYKVYEMDKKDKKNPEESDNGNIDLVIEPPKLKLWEKLILCFSFYTNTVKVMDATSVPGRLACLDGIRFFSMTWVIIGHTYAFILPFANNIGDYAAYIFTNWRYQAIINATFSVDSFFVLSGILTAYMFLKAARKMGTLRSLKFWILFYVHRFLRLTPSYMLFMGTYTALMIYISNGPFWNQLTPFDGQNCVKNWWYNLLYINNFQEQNDMCMGWTWYLANDMQFYYVVAPIVLTLIFYFGKWGALASIPGIIGPMVATGVISKSNGFESTRDDDQKQFNLIYTKPWCRAHSYVIGLLVGYLIMEHKLRKWRLHPAVVVTGWCLAATACLGTLYGLSDTLFGNQVLTVHTTALYYSLNRPLWAAGLGWLIYACEAGYGSYINQFLSWKAFIPLSRLTYSAYLVHLILQFSVFGSLQAPLILDDLTMLFLNFGFVVSSYGVGFMLTILWESPFIRIEKVLLG